MQQRGEGGFIGIHAYPQAGKSSLVSVRLPAWALGCDPTLRIGLACYNETHAEGFSQLVIDLMNDPVHKRYFPDQNARLAESRPARKSWTTSGRKRLHDSQWSFVSLGMGTGAIGKGFDIIIIDDPYGSYQDSISPAINTALQNWWKSTIRPRINDSTVVIFMFHRYHKNDIMGWLLENEPGKWRMVRIPSECREHDFDPKIIEKYGADPTGRKPGEVLEGARSKEFFKIIEEEDEVTYWAQFLGIPSDDSASKFKEEWFHKIKPNEVPLDIKEWARGWDFAVSIKDTADYTVGVLVGMHRGNYYIVDVRRFRMEWPDAKLEILKTALEDPPGTITGGEKGGQQIGFIQDLMREPAFIDKQFYPITLRGDKSQRAAGWAAKARTGRIYIVESSWTKQYVKELEDFDGLGLKHDDQVDASSNAFTLLAGKQGDTYNEQKTEPPIGSQEWLAKIERQQDAEWERKVLEGDGNEIDRRRRGAFARARRR